METIVLILGILILVGDAILCVKLGKADLDELCGIVGVSFVFQIVFIIITAWMLNQSPEQKYVACVFYGKNHSVEIPNGYCEKYLTEE